MFLAQLAKNVHHKPFILNRITMFGFPVQMRQAYDIYELSRDGKGDLR